MRVDLTFIVNLNLYLVMLSNRNMNPCFIAAERCYFYAKDGQAKLHNTSKKRGTTFNHLHS